MSNYDVMLDKIESLDDNQLSELERFYQDILTEMGAWDNWASNPNEDSDDC